MKIDITDYNKIETATPLFPKLMHECAIDLLKDDFNKWKEKEQEVYRLRKALREAEEDMQALKELFYKESAVFDITYSSTIKEVSDIDSTQSGDIIQRMRKNQ